jgi:hypothetical protein
MFALLAVPPALEDVAVLPGVLQPPGGTRISAIFVEEWRRLVQCVSVL